MTRQIVLDTETTGIEISEGHKIIEIGCVEVINREITGKHYHQYIKPEREIDPEAQAVHGISQEMLADKPVFAVISQEFIEFIRGAELVIHNAPFDVGHINAEFARLAEAGLAEPLKVEDICTVLDTLTFARKKHPGQRNSLDALCKRYGIDNSSRTLHGALLDSEILAEVYLAMTGGQMELSFGLSEGKSSNDAEGFKPTRLNLGESSLKVIHASEEELEAHREMLAKLEKSGGQHYWGE
mgnify:FL=1